MNPIISVENLSFGYGGLTVLEDATFSVAEHDLVCVVGPNGGGKTTLLRLMLGLLRPAAGRVRVFGLSPERARTRVGYVPQRPQHDLSFPLTVMDVVLMGRLGRSRGWGPYGRADREAAMRALDAVNLAEMDGRPFADLSAGQRQRVLIARALASEADLLLLDEPTANLDAVAEQQMYDLLRRVSRRATVVFVSHDLRLVTSYVERAICVNRLVAAHPVGEITGEMIGRLYGPAWRLVRHDQCEDGDQRCLTS
ncbi:MAG: ABC transporter ATP-binding protein [Pseudomonadota bacterium]